MPPKLVEEFAHQSQQRPSYRSMATIISFRVPDRAWLTGICAGAADGAECLAEVVGERVGGGDRVLAGEW
jgi:hypothetical protein